MNKVRIRDRGRLPEAGSFVGAFFQEGDPSHFRGSSRFMGNVLPHEP
jgi:hypothetical protein